MTQTPDPNNPDPNNPDQQGGAGDTPPPPAPPPPAPPPPPHGDPITGHGEAQWGQGAPPPPPGYDPSQQQPQYGQPQQPQYQQPQYQQPGYQQPGYQQGYPQAQVGAPYGIHPGTGIPYSDKSKLAAGLLNIFVAGVGRMYIGQVGLGVAQLLVTIFTCGIGALWPIIDGILILTKEDAKDAQGRILKS
jgi:TM2 domain-containing membrane protein YozV